MNSRKRPLALPLAIVMLMLCPDAPTSAPRSHIKTLVTSEGTFRYVENEVLVRFRDGADLNRLGLLEQRFGGDFRDVTDRPGRRRAILRLRNSENIFHAARILRSDPDVKYACPNYVGTFAELQVPDSLYPYQWSLRKIRANEGWENVTTGDSSVVVAILDSGYSDHQDMPYYGSRVIQNPVHFNFAKRGGEYVETYDDLQDHAMGVAGIVAAYTGNLFGIAGTAWYPRVWFIKVGTSEGDYGTVEPVWLEEGIECVVDSAIANPDKRYIINASLNIPIPTEDLPGFVDVVEYADENNVLIVAAAGNTVSGDSPHGSYQIYYPALLSRFSPDEFFANVISVGAVDTALHATDYTNYLGPDTCEVYVDLSAPGGVSAAAYEDSMALEAITLSSACVSCYRTMWGTTVSTAHVSGAAALLWSGDPYLTHHEIKNILKASTYDPSEDDYSYATTWCAVPDSAPQEDDPILTFYPDEGCRHYRYNRKKGTGILNIDIALDHVKNFTVPSSFAGDSTLSGDVYLVGDVTVNSGTTLTLEAGCRVFVLNRDLEESGEDPDHIELTVYGELIANGTGSDPVQFLPAGHAIEPGYWTGIRLSGSASSAQLSHCYISYAYHGIKSYGQVDISDCLVTDSEVHGLFLLGGYANGSLIGNSSFCDNGSAGIMISSCDSVAIDTCQTSGNYYGVYVSGSDHTTINKCTAEENSHEGIKAVGCDPCDVAWCLIESNEQNGVYFSGSSGDIENTKIWKNDLYGILCSGSDCDPVVGHCKIEQNLVGVKIEYSAEPMLGLLMMGGYNSIYNQQWYVYTSPSYSIWAENNWWGTGSGESPNPAKFQGDVDYTPYLTSDPVLYLQRSAVDRTSSISLSQNYPNPFHLSGSTTIRYFIPSGNRKVYLAVYDVAGRRVATLVDEVQQAGHYTVSWDGRNSRGGTVAPGIYFCRLTLGREKIARKIVVY